MSAVTGSPWELLTARLVELVDEKPEKLVFLFGAGAVVPVVPGVAEVVAEAETWIGSSGDAAEGSPVAAPAVGEIGPEDYGVWMSNILTRYGEQGQRAFLQYLTLKAYHGERRDEHRKELCRTHEPLKEQVLGELIHDNPAWELPEGLESWAQIVADTPRLPRRVLTTNFDPLLRVALERARLEVRPITTSRDHDPDADRSGERDITVLHLHGDLHGGATLHSADELRQDRPRLWRWLLEYLQDKTLLVVGYSGWDDIVRTTLSTCLLEPSRLSVIWPVRERDEAHLATTHPHLHRRLKDWHPAAVPYYGVDRDELFGALDGSRRKRRRARGGRKKGSPSVELAVDLRTKFGFGFDGLSHAEPKVVFWPHRLRRPHLIHGVHALAAAALTERGLTVELHLDDLGVAEHDEVEETAEEFEEAVRHWFAGVGVDPPTVVRLSQTIDETDPQVRASLWELATRINAADVRLKDLMLAAKVVSPRLAQTSPAAAADVVARSLNARVSGRLLRSVYTFYALEQTMSRHGLPADRHAIITLGGVDEKPMWEGLWHRVSPRAAGHVFVPRLDWRSGDSPWSISALLWGASYGHEDLAQFLTASMQEGESAGIIEWVWNCGVMLWRWLADNDEKTVQIGDLRVGNPQAAVDALHTRPLTAGTALAEAVGEWFYAR